jgi:hypothetical protein
MRVTRAHPVPSLSRSQRFSGCSLPQAVPMPTAVESRERIFSTRIEPSESPDRRGFRGQVSAESWGHPSPLVLARVGQDREMPPTKVARHPPTAGTQRTSLHRLQARANSRSDRKMRTSIKRPSLLVVADLCRPLAGRGSSPSTPRSPLRADAPAPRGWGTGPGAPGAVLGRATPYYECQYYRSRTYKIVSGIDFRFGRNGVFGRIYL